MTIIHRRYCQHCRSENPDIKTSKKINKKGELVQNYMCRNCNTERARKYRATPNGRARIYAAVYRSIEKHYGKQMARMKFNQDLRKGKIKKKSCIECGNEKSEFHHNKGYENPLVGVWLCRPCHANSHKTC